MIRGHSQNVQKFTPFYHWQPPKMHFEGCHWLSENSILIEWWNCPQLNVQSIKGSLQNASLEPVNDKMVQTFVHSESVSFPKKMMYIVFGYNNFVSEESKIIFEMVIPSKGQWTIEQLAFFEPVDISADSESCHLSIFYFL